MQRRAHHNKHGYRGVFFERQRGYFRARLDDRWLGRFESEIDAATAYDQAARQKYGADARLNFPAEGEKGSTRAQIVSFEDKRMMVAGAQPIESAPTDGASIIAIESGGASCVVSYDPDNEFFPWIQEDNRLRWRWDIFDWWMPCATEIASPL